ncbi:hypothetical protein Gbro_0054 [Gordonia bronchialis DSM 43247]|uniref:Uncharacterized protein n=1 Tax=Gordonia bronchialis (strain ATCC 25592 / DSM 43247 / BCRC 13721 / JCM 3198 / KCTC 3076 / NBRC 16047 / NCTC 10667) TaxID=526226 RepID=D0LA80_GORB4|nr:hypothetical protein Gbro_0054 [Gordonia bronchialis DSM 43247]
MLLTFGDRQQRTAGIGHASPLRSEILRSPDAAG